MDIHKLVESKLFEDKEQTERQKLNALRKSNPEFDSKYNELKAELKRMAGVARRHPGAPVENARKELDDFLRDNGIDPYKL